MNMDVAGFIEFLSVAKGYLALDAMVKTALVTILNANIINPGRYFVAFTGDVASVESAMEEALSLAGKDVYDYTILRNFEDSILQMIQEDKGKIPETDDALGFLEMTSFVAAIEAADRAVKLASVEILEISTGVETGGKGILKLNGPIGDINYVIEKIAAAAKEKDQLFRDTVIPGPHNDIKRFISGH